jgi:Tfp pilus assembly protein PilO
MKNEGMKTVALSALAVICVGGGLIYWQFNNRSEAEARVAKLRSELPDAEQVNADLAKSQSELETARVQLEHLERSLPEDSYIPTLLAELEMLGISKNVQVTGVRPIWDAAPTDPKAAPEESGDGYQKLDIDITGQGTYRAFLEFVSSLKSFPKILAVTQVNMQPKQGVQGNSSDLDATIRLRAFVFKEPLPPFEGSSEALRKDSENSGTGEDAGGSSEELSTAAPRKGAAL